MRIGVHRHHGPLARARRSWSRCTAHHPKVHVVVLDATTTSLVPQLASGQPRPRRREPARSNDPDLVAEPLFEEDHVLIAPARPPAGRPRAVDPPPTSPSTRCCSSRRAPAFRDELDAQAAAVGVTLAPRPRSTACASSPRWPSRASAPPSCRPAPPPARQRRVVAGPGRGAGAALGRPGPPPQGPPSAPARALRDVLAEVISSGAAQPGIHPTDRRQAGEEAEDRKAGRNDGRKDGAKAPTRPSARSTTRSKSRSSK